MRTTGTSSLVTFPAIYLVLICEGTREIVWLESDQVDVNQFTQVVNEIAELVRPYPIAGLRPRDQTIMAVNDANTTDAPRGQCSYFFDLMLDDTSWPATGGTTSVRGRRGPPTAHAPLVIRTTETPGRAPVENLEMEEVPKHGIMSFPEGGTSNSVQLDPPPPSAPSLLETTFPFVGVLTVEDPNGLRQSIKIIFSLTVMSHAHQSAAVTQVIVDNLKVQIPLPSRPADAPSLSIPDKQHFRCLGLFLSIGPELPEPNLCHCEPIYQHPEMNWYVTKIGHTKEVNIGVTPTFAATPSLQIPMSMKSATSVDYIALSQYIDFGKAYNSEARDNRRHIWNYPIFKTLPNGADISLPCHISQTTYATTAPPSTIRTCAEATLEFNPGSRPKNKLKRSRKYKQCFNLGDAKHVVMLFSVVVKRTPADRFLQFIGPGSTTELNHKIDLTDNCTVIHKTQPGRSTPLEQSIVEMRLRGSLIDGRS